MNLNTSIFGLASNSLQLFNQLGRELDVHPTALMPLEAIQNERARFKVWCGNLGALQQSFASLDYRLRDAPVMLSNVTNLLQQLQSNLAESSAVVSGTRLPFEAMEPPADLSDSDMTDEEDDLVNELAMRLSSIVDVLKSLYILGFKIRNPMLRPSPVKATQYREIDPETGIDIIGAYAEFDRRHVQAMIQLLRRDTDPTADPGYLATRLAAAITTRRRNFRYWEKHGQKLSLHAPSREGTSAVLAQTQRPAHQSSSQGDPGLRPTLEPLRISGPMTILSVTEATRFEDTPDDRTDAETIISYASTALDADGHHLQIPKPPQDALLGKDFVCPYCSVICPAKYGQSKAWRSHVIHDLQPYICTYYGCCESERLYGSRRQWVEHENTHRQRWRCYEHPGIVYLTPDGLREHLYQSHQQGQPTKDQVETLVELSAISLADDRLSCPICYQDGPFHKGLENHLANHLERIALFALPSIIEEAGSAQAKSGKRSSRQSGDSLAAPVFDDPGRPTRVFSKEFGSGSDSDGSPIQSSRTGKRLREAMTTTDPADGRSIPTDRTQEAYNVMRRIQDKVDRLDVTSIASPSGKPPPLQTSGSVEVDSDSNLENSVILSRRPFKLKRVDAVSKARASFFRRIGPCSTCYARKVTCTHFDSTLFEAAYQAQKASLAQAAQDDASVTARPSSEPPVEPYLTGGDV
ncbi:hypothetical protein QBC47DRAFT_331655 [Echria macrotheca]|uniref:Oxidoreductase acuF-like C2H2 type zinc-finger domain-containing protein n=1 Tax=Echria macrotheca TaxID=438768 RepID=A0AAJ0B2L5_9PEZI|nr:hypothetical protein QBC47DRAFT_331655 [Echria macrotheca]